MYGITRDCHMPDSDVEHVGDLNSNAKGSGARFNVEKPDYSFMFLDALLIKESELNEILIFLAEFQRTGDYDSLKSAYHAAYELASIQKTNEDKYVLDSVIRVWQHGAKKYKQWNWFKGMDWSIPIGCIARHYLDIVERGEINDPETGEPHLSHIICNIQMLLEYSASYHYGNNLPHA